MLRLFIYNKIKQFGANYYSGSHAISIQNSKLVISNINSLPNLTFGQFIVVSNIEQAFEVTGISFNSRLRQYTLDVNGPSVVLNNETRLLSFYFVDESLSESAELDIDSFNLEMESEIESLKNPDEQKMEISKDLVLKDTERNNFAFGNLFNINKYVDLTGTQRMFSNYNPIKTVEAKVFEDGIQLFSGQLRVFSIENSRLNGKSYVCKLVGQLYHLKSMLGESLMTDLDLSDMKHIYQFGNIMNSWGGFINYNNPNSIGTSNQIQKYNAQTDWYVYEDFEFGKNYIYPFIDYGNFYNRDLEVVMADYKSMGYEFHKLQNYKPGVYVFEYLNRIFNSRNQQFEFSDRLDPELTNKIKKLFIPWSEKGLSSILTSNRFIAKLNKTLVSNHNYLATLPGFTINSSPRILNGQNSFLYLPLRFTNTIESTFVRNDGYYGDENYSPSYKTKSIIKFERTLKTDGTVSVTFLYNDTFPNSINLIPLAQATGIVLEVVKRDYNTASKAIIETVNYSNTLTNEANFDVTDWEVIATQSWDLNRTRNVPILNRSFSTTIQIPEIDFEEGDELQVRLKLIFSHDINFNLLLPPQIRVQQAEISLPSQRKRIEYQAKLGDEITPKAPKDVKQMDFLKSILTIFNAFIVYDEDNMSWKISVYDDYYLKFQTNNLKQSAIDITSKVDWNEPFKIESNLDLAKEYSFKFSDGDDYFNKQVQEQSGRGYGEFFFVDSYGLEDKKEVETLFVPSVMLSIGGTYRFYNQYTEDGSYLEKKEMDDVGLRILFFNGVRACNEYKITDLGIQTGSYGSGFYSMFVPTILWDNLKWYPQACNYLMTDLGTNKNQPLDNNGNPRPLVPIEDIHFFRPQTFYFELRDNAYLNLEGSYKYWRNAITQDVNPMMKIIECTAFFTKSELKNINHDTPLFLNTKEFGNGYFKLLKVVWGGNQDKCLLTLQQVTM